MANDSTTKRAATGQDITKEEFIRFAKEKGATEEMIEEAIQVREESRKIKGGISYIDFLKKLD